MYIPFPPTDPGIKFPNFDIFFLSFDNLSFLFNNRYVFGIFRAYFISGKNRLTTQQKDNKKWVTHWFRRLIQIFCLFNSPNLAQEISPGTLISLTEALSLGRANAKPWCDKHFLSHTPANSSSKIKNRQDQLYMGTNGDQIFQLFSKISEEVPNHFHVQDGLKYYSPGTLIMREDWIPFLSPCLLERLSGIYRHLLCDVGRKRHMYICICCFTITCVMYRVAHC